MNCQYCGKEIEHKRNAKYCSTDCLWQKNLIERLKKKLERYGNKIKEIRIVDSKGEKSVKWD
jgi:hypothetical protein